MSLFVLPGGDILPHMTDHVELDRLNVIAVDC
jgi:hypothetical protein